MGSELGKRHIKVILKLLWISGYCSSIHGFVAKWAGVGPLLALSLIEVFCTLSYPTTPPISIFYSMSKCLETQ